MKTKKSFDFTDVQSLIHRAMAEDTGISGDITSNALIGVDHKAMAVMRARRGGVVSGINVAIDVFKAASPSLKIKRYVKNGDKVSKNSILLTVHGPARSILLAERTALNFISHLSGIASLARQYVDAIKGTEAKILDTRKTTPGLRFLEKQAVIHGGGNNHRMGLYDAFLIKDNHLFVSKSINVALKIVKKSINSTTKIIIEVDTIKQLDEVLKTGGADVVLLDNMPIKTLRRAVAMVQAVPRSQRPLTEASGGVNLKTVRAIAKTGIDRISVGALTHSAPILDIGLDFKVQPTNLTTGR
jgi:nicotinate-nucleotide pyrophosphorylase (carboxylating)